MTTDYRKHQLEVQAKWKEKFPRTFAQPVECGIWHPEEWDSVIETLCSLIEQYLNIKQGYEGELLDFRVSQTKDKFGGLRFYVYGGDDFISGAVAMAGRMCKKDPY